MAALMAIGAISTAVAVLLINIVSNDVVKYMPQSKAIGPMSPNADTSPWLTIAETPVFSSAVAIGIMAAMRTMLSQLMVLYAASTLRKHPVTTISKPAAMTAVTGAIGMKSNTITAIIASIIIAASGALYVRATRSAISFGCPISNQSSSSVSIFDMFSHRPCTSSVSPALSFTSGRFSVIYSRLRFTPSTFT